MDHLNAPNVEEGGVVIVGGIDLAFEVDGRAAGSVFDAHAEAAREQLRDVAVGHEQAVAHDKAGSAVWDQWVEREIDASDFWEEGGDAGFDRGGVKLGPRIGHIIIRIAANENHRPVLRHYDSLQGEYFRPGEILRTVLGEFAQTGLGISRQDRRRDQSIRELNSPPGVEVWRLTRCPRGQSASTCLSDEGPFPLSP